MVLSLKRARQYYKLRHKLLGTLFNKGGRNLCGSIDALSFIKCFKERFLGKMNVSTYCLFPNKRVREIWIRD